MVHIDSINKRYGHLPVLKDVTLQIAPGEFFALLGPNGAGKTTIIRILLDFTRADSGRVTVRGVPSTDPQARSKIGYLPENIRLPNFLTGREYLKRNALLCGLLGKSAELAIDRVLEIVGMKERQKSRCGTYSKGMIQRIGLASSLINNPEFLILDEPTNGLDPIGIREFRMILENLKTQKVTLFLNSHILSEVEKLCNSAAIMSNGNLIVKDVISNLVHEGETLEDVFVRVVSGKKS